MAFCHLQENKYDKKLMNTATKTGIDAAKTALKTVFQKTAEATGDLTQNKIADKITSIGKPKEKEKPEKVEEIYIPPEKRQQINDGLRLFEHKFYFLCIKMGFQTIANLFDTTLCDKDLLQKSGLKFMINKKKLTTLTKKLELKHQCQDQIYVIAMMRILL